MKTLLGLLLILLGIGIGLYIGVYILFWGGIVSMYHGIAGPEMSFWTTLWGFIKFSISGVVGWFLFWFFGYIGASFFE